MSTHPLPLSRTKVASFARLFVRERTNLALLVALPVVGIVLYGRGLGAFPETLFGDAAIDPTTAGRITGAVFAGAALSGILGLFQAISARETDTRLVRCGCSRPELLVNRVLTVTLVSLLGAVVTVGVLWQVVDIGSLSLTIGAFVVVGFTYSLLGILVGSVLPRELEGSLALVFLADMDTFLTLEILDIDVVVGQLFPLYYPHKIARSAVLDGAVDGSHLVGAAGYLAVLAVLAVAVSLSVTGQEGTT